MVNAIKPEVLEKIVGTIPVKRLGTPSEIASIVGWLAGDESGFTTGAEFAVNGGLHMGWTRSGHFRNEAPAAQSVRGLFTCAPCTPPRRHRTRATSSCAKSQEFTPAPRRGRYRSHLDASTALLGVRGSCDCAQDDGVGRSSPASEPTR